MVKNKVFIHDLFLGLQEEMKISLLNAKKTITHPGTKGDHSENCWIELLQKYLPKRYQAEKAIILDSYGNLSDQIDIVIFDRQYSPFLLNNNGTLYIPVESVYAVIEVKPDLNKENIIYTSKNAFSVRCLKRTSASIPHAGGKYSPRKLFPILAGIITLDSKWNPTFGKSFKTAIFSLKNSHEIDFGCVLNKGAFSLSITKKSTRNINISKPNHALIFFFLNLLDKLQSLGTVPAIEMDKYWSILK